MFDYSIIWYGNQKEDESCGDVMPFFLRKEKFNKEIRKEYYANPELYFHELRLFVERFVIVSVDGNADHQEYRQCKNQNMKESIDTSFF